MRRWFPVVPSSSDVQHPRRLSLPPIVAERCASVLRELPCLRVISDPADTRYRSLSLVRAPDPAALQRRLISRTRCLRLQCAFSHCASSRILCKTDDRKLSSPCC